MIGRIMRLARRIWRASTTSTPASWFVEWLRGEQESDSGIRLDGKRALTYAPVWYAVNRIAGHVAQLPLVLYERQGERKKRRAAEHPVYRLLKRRPNAIMSASVFKELLTYHALVWGDGRAAIVRDGRGDPVELIPLLPDRTRTVLVDGAKWHVSEILVDDTSQRRETRRFRDEHVLHIAGLGYDGVTGYPLWELARNSFGLGMATEKHGNRFFRNSAIPGLLLEAPEGVLGDDTEAQKFLHAFRRMQEGLDNTAKTVLLRHGVKASRLAQSGQEAQWIEQRRFQRQDVALWFLLEAITGDDASVSYSSLEQKHLAYLVNCLNRWLVKWQEECEAKLLRFREREADSHFVRFQTGALLRSDTPTTYKTLAMGVRGMLLTINEARDLLDLDEVEGGDELLNPAITPGRAGGDVPAARAPALPPERTRAMVADRVLELIGVEQRRVRAACDKPAGDFAAWLGTFYNNWQHTLARALTAFVGPSAAARHAQRWCDASRDRLSAEAPANRALLLEGWLYRAESLAGDLVDEMLAQH